MIPTTQGAPNGRRAVNAHGPDTWKALGNTATVVAFTPPKRAAAPETAGRRPRCKDDFDTLAMAVVGIAGKPTLWNAAKERVRRWADRDRVSAGLHQGSGRSSSTSTGGPATTGTQQTPSPATSG